MVGAHFKVKFFLISWENIKKVGPPNFTGASGNDKNPEQKKSICWSKKILESTGDTWKSRGGFSILINSLIKKNPTNKEY